jgi:DNA-directed RNA polymerase specialized sigma24 family protein
MLSKCEDLSQRKIAEIMKISEEAVESLLQRAKRNLQTKLRKFYNTEFQPTDFSLASD